MIYTEIYRAIAQPVFAAANQMAVGGYSPRSLFAAGETGVWYDPSDFTTLFQDAAGTTPVTAVEQPCGLMLDKSKGLVLGAELVVAQDLTNAQWGQLPATPSSSTTATTLTFGGQFSGRADTISVASGKWYEFSFEAKRISGNTTLRCYTDPNQIDNGAADFVVGVDFAKYTRRVHAISSSVEFGWQDRNASGYGTIEIRNISVRELPGNHATQATSANRPVVSARVNLLTKTEDLTHSAWKTVTVGVAAGVSDPDGGTTAFTLTASGNSSFFYQIYAIATGTPYVPSVYIRRRTGVGAITLRNGLVDTAITVNTNWTRVTPVGYVAGGGANSFVISIAASGDAIDVWHPQLETGSTATRYQRVNTATDYDTAGFPTYLKFDGVDDSMATGNIDFTSTSAMTVFAGVRKLSDATGQIFLESSTNATSNNGAFGVFAGNGAAAIGAYWTFGNRGSTNAITSTQVTTLAAPTTTVVSGQMSIQTTPRSVVRLNGSVSGTSVESADTGNFGTYPLYIGSRAGTNYFYNGNLMSLIIRGAQSSAAQITSGETYVNSKTKAY